MLRGDESANEVMSIETAARRLPEAVELALTMR
jgi:hypothetical protein